MNMTDGDSDDCENGEDDERSEVEGENLTGARRARQHLTKFNIQNVAIM